MTFLAGKVNMVSVWSEPTSGNAACFSTPVIDMNFVSPTFSGPVNLYCATDWYCYARNAKTGALLWSYATGGQCYGRPQAADVNGDGYTESFFPSHEGYIYSFDSQGNRRFVFANLYIREGYNDGVLNTVGSVQYYGGGTATGGAITSSTSTTLTDTTQNWGANSFIRGVVGTNSLVKITTGTGSGATLYEIDTALGSLITFQPGVVFPATDATSRYQIIPRYVSDAYFQHAGTLKLNVDGNWYLYITGFDNTCCKINADTGSLIWEFHSLENNEPFPLVADPANPATGTNLKVYFGSIDKHLYALNEADGSLDWATAFNEGLDAFLTMAPVHGDGVQKMLVNERSSSDTSAGRLWILDAITGAIEYDTSWQLGDLNTQPLALPRPWDTTEKYNIYIAGLANLPSMFDDTCRLLWQDIRGDASDTVAFRSSPISADINRDGFDEIFHCNNTSLMCVYTQGGARLATFSSNGGVEGTPSINNLFGDGELYASVPEIGGYMTLYHFVVT